MTSHIEREEIQLSCYESSNCVALESSFYVFKFLYIFQGLYGKR